MAKKKSKYDVDRVRLRVETNVDKEVQKYLMDCHQKYKEPKPDFLEPQVPGEDSVTVMAGDYMIGDIYPEDETEYYANVGNTLKCYISTDVDEDEPDFCYCTVVLVVRRAISEADLKRARRNKYLIVGFGILLVGILAVVSLMRGKTFDGVVCLLMLPVIYWAGIIRTRGKDEVFLPKEQRKQKR